MNTIDLEFDNKIFNDTGNGDIEMDVSDYANDFDIKIKDLTLVLLVEVLEDFLQPLLVIRIVENFNNETQTHCDGPLKKKRRNDTFM
jgi:hypothetical protein